MRAVVFSLLISAALLSAADERPFNTWSEYLGGADSSQYTSLKQVNKTTVKQLEVAWTYPAGMGNRTFNPIIAEGVMYVIGKNANTIVALDAATGKRALVARGHRAWPGRTRDTRGSHRARHQLLGEQRQIRPALDLCRRRLPPRSGRQNRRSHQILWR